MTTHLIPHQLDPMGDLREQLDRLVSAGRQKQAAAKALEAASDVIQRRHLEAAARLAERMEWRPVASVILWEAQTCSSCGSVHHIFRGFSTLMRRRHDSIERYVAAQCLDPSLPQGKHSLEGTAPLCVECVPEAQTPTKGTPWEFRPSTDRENLSNGPN